MQESFESRNVAVEFTLFCETSASMSKTLRELRTERMKIFGEFARHCGDKSAAKTRYSLTYNKRKLVNMSEDNMNGSDDSLNDCEYSQESTLMELCDIEDEIKTTMDDLKTIQLKKNTVSLLFQDKTSNGD